MFGSPKDPGCYSAACVRGGREGVNHIDTSDFYGPHVTNRLIREALHPYPDDLSHRHQDRRLARRRRVLDSSPLPRS